MEREIKIKCRRTGQKEGAAGGKWKKNRGRNDERVWCIEGHRSERWQARGEIARWREGTRKAMRGGREGGLSGGWWGGGGVGGCLLSLRPELYLELQTGSSAPERPDDPAWFRNQAEPTNTRRWSLGADSTCANTRANTRIHTHRRTREHAGTVLMYCTNQKPHTRSWICCTYECEYIQFCMK